MDKRISPDELFVLTPDENELRARVATRLSKDERFQEIVRKCREARDFDKDLFWEALAYFKDAGLTMYGIPDEYGGISASSRGSVILTDVICQHDGAIGLSLGASVSLAGSPIALFGTEEQKQKWLPKIASGDIVACYCQSEPEAGSDITSIKARAVEQNGAWVINGQKHFITNGSEASLALVIARIGPHPHKGLAVFVVDLENAKRLGQATVLRNEHKAGLHMSPTSAIQFDDCIADSVLGTIVDDPALGFISPEAWGIINSTLAGSRPTGISGQSIGIAKGALREALFYMKNPPRMQFGMPLLETDRQKERVLRIQAGIRMGELLSWQASVLRDKLGRKNSKPWQREASMAKLWCAEFGVEATSEAIQLCGGVGYTNPRIFKFWHDARIVPIYEGTSDVQCMIVAGETLMRMMKAFSGEASPFSNDPLEQEAQRLLMLAWEKFPFDPKTVKTLPAPYFPIAKAIAAAAGAMLVEEGCNATGRDMELLDWARTLAKDELLKAENCLNHHINAKTSRGGA